MQSASPTLHYGETFQIEATSDNTISYSSENEYHATVSTTGLITGKRIGKTNIILNDGKGTKKFPVTITPESNLFPEPDMSWGTSRSAMKSKYGEPYGETDGAIMYEDYSTNAPVLMFMFDDNDKLEASIVMVKTAYSSELGTFLSERYVIATISEEDYTILYMNSLSVSTATMIVGASVYNASYWMVGYMPYTPSRSSSIISSQDITETLEELLPR